jgi:hypothetical protein
MDEFRRSDEERLIATLKELDAAKASMRKVQVELANAISALARRDRSPNCLYTFETVKQAMNEATVRYRRAVESFNVFCQQRSEAAVRAAHATAS